MGKTFKLIALLSMGLLLGCGEKQPKVKPIALQEVDAACGLCHFGLSASACQLAVKVDGGAYFVEGVEEIPHEEMHKEGGICMTIRRAKVSGRIDRDKFVALSYELLPLK